MNLDTFQLGSPVHIACLAICLLLFVIVAYSGTRLQRDPAALRVLRRVIVTGCLLSWIATVIFLCLPGTFRWDASLPLQFCNLANLLGAWAVGRTDRRAQTLVYFWALALSSWAFLTPSLTSGPALPGFWIFWIYHLFIPVALAWVLFVDRYRPVARDLRFALIVTLIYMGLLAMLNFATGWNYGFVGRGTPAQPSLMDFLGPYPLRLLWLALIGSALFVLALIPWLGRKPNSSPAS